MFCLLVLLIVLLLTFVIYSTKKPYNFPPGPGWLPIIGSLPYLKKLSKTIKGQHLVLLELSKQWKTNVVGLKLGNEIVITVFSYPLIKSILNSEEYDGRPQNFFMRLRSLNTNKGITGTDGHLWIVQRNFVVRHLRNLGLGKKSMEVKIKRELDEIINDIKGNNKAVQIGRLIAPGVLNVLWSLIAGNRIGKEDPRLGKLLDLLQQRTKAFDMSGGILNHFPWLRHIAPEKTGYHIIQHLNKQFKDFLMETINEHHQTWSAERNDDLIYAFISEMKRSAGEANTFTDDQLLIVCLDLFIAGSQTTSNTLDFAFLMMLRNPRVQTKAQEVLDHFYDEKRKPLTYFDRHETPYIEAVLLEVSRFLFVAPVIGPRRVLKDTILDGYNIPKEATVLIHLYSVNMSKELWGDPEVFRPERFLDCEGNLVFAEKVLSFGLGRRRCLGESLARNCIFIFFGEILRNYKIVQIPDKPMPSGIPLPGLTLTPEKYFAHFIPRR